MTVSHETFEKEGDLPVFVVRVKDDAGNVDRTQVQAEYPDRASRAGAGRREDTSRDSSVIGHKKEKETLTTVD